jgi:putative flavoprotein involved in K+ transport
MNQLWDVIVIGGGQAGLASGYYLKKLNLRFLILEASSHAYGSWPHYYDSLKLFSPSSLSSLPGMKMQGCWSQYPYRNEVIQYLEDYARKFELPIRRQQKVTSIEKDQDFAIHTESGEFFKAKAIINATGSFNCPFKPSIEGTDVFQGEILHASEYRTPEPFKDRRILVVGGGNSAVQIAVELSAISHTSLAVLKPIKIVNQKRFGIDLHYWLRSTGLDAFQFWRLGKKTPTTSSVIDLGDYEVRLKEGNPDQRKMFTTFTRDGVVWPDSTEEKVDTVIFATGYRPELTHLKETGAIGLDGKPLQRAGISVNVSGLYFVGLEGQRSFSSATLRGVGKDSKYVVRHIKRYLQVMR